MTRKEFLDLLAVLPVAGKSRFASIFQQAKTNRAQGVNWGVYGRQISAFGELLLFPRPKKVNLQSGVPFALNEKTVIGLPHAPTPNDRTSAQNLVDRAFAVIGERIEIATSTGPEGRNIILLGEGSRIPQLQGLLEKRQLSSQGYLCGLLIMPEAMGFAKNLVMVKALPG